MAGPTAVIKKNTYGTHSYVAKDKQAQISVVMCQRVKRSKTKKLQHYGLEDSYERTEIWDLEDLLVLDGRDPDSVSRI